MVQHVFQVFAGFQVGAQTAMFIATTRGAEADLAFRVMGDFHTLGAAARAVNMSRRYIRIKGRAPFFGRFFAEFIIVINRCDPRLAGFTVDTTS